MTSIFIMDASDQKNDIESREIIKNICMSHSYLYNETLDTEKIILPNNADIIIVHLGFITNSALSEIENKVKDIRLIMQSSSLLIGVSSSNDFINMGNIQGVPAYKYQGIVNLLKEAIKKSTQKKKDLKTCLEELIKNTEIKSSLSYLFLPIDIDMQALEILWNENKEEALIYSDEMRIYWTNEILSKRYTQSRALIDQLPHDFPKEEIKKFSIKEFISLLNIISEGKWDGKNHYRNWFSKLTL